MKFSYDFSEGRALVICFVETNREPDNRVLNIMRGNKRNFLPMQMRREKNGYVFSYSIAGTTNMKAWMGEAAKEIRPRMKEKAQLTIQFLMSLFTEGISADQLITEEKYMYVDDATQEVKFICIPVFPEKRSAGGFKDMPDIPPVIPQYPEKTQIKSANSIMAQPLPDIPPAPKSDMIFEEYSIYREKNTGSKQQEKEADVFPAFNQWEQTGFSENLRRTKEDIRPMYEAVKAETEFDAGNQGETYQEIRPEKASIFVGDKDKDEEGTVLLEDQQKDETMLLTSLKLLNAHLIRERTGETFAIGQKECRIGKNKAFVDIHIKDNPTISREHCMIIYSDGEYYIQDCNSKNHTYVNGRQLYPGDRIKLEDYSEIRLSNEKFTFKIGYDI